eukprot:TRINITY_DN5303_c0_g1_i1.p1 TRINITY_DN5303_c0_g1~~TRINITY_DN5303_c0_g1_i1.p1  ORF type:complete len:308 (+),score=40.10 TRINITY_DN5303_c0_g1_i1:820-1743(+)
MNLSVDKYRYMYYLFITTDDYAMYEDQLRKMEDRQTLLKITDRIMDQDDFMKLMRIVKAALAPHPYVSILLKKDRFGKFHPNVVNLTQGIIQQYEKYLASNDKADIPSWMQHIPESWFNFYKAHLYTILGKSDDAESWAVKGLSHLLQRTTEGFYPRQLADKWKYLIDKYKERETLKNSPTSPASPSSLSSSSLSLSTTPTIPTATTTSSPLSSSPSSLSPAQNIVYQSPSPETTSNMSCADDSEVLVEAEVVYDDASGAGYNSLRLCYVLDEESETVALASDTALESMEPELTALDEVYSGFLKQN